MVDANLVVAEMHRRHIVEGVDRRRLLDREAEHLALLNGPFVERQIVLVEIDGGTACGLRRSHPCDVIDVGVREQNVFDAQAVPAHGRNQRVDLVPRVDDDALPGPLTADDEPVLEERRHCMRFENHRVPCNLSR